MKKSWWFSMDKCIAVCTCEWMWTWYRSWASTGTIRCSIKCSDCTIVLVSFTTTIYYMHFLMRSHTIYAWLVCFLLKSSSLSWVFYFPFKICWATSTLWSKLSINPQFFSSSCSRNSIFIEYYELSIVNTLAWNCVCIMHACVQQQKVWLPRELANYNYHNWSLIISIENLFLSCTHLEGTKLHLLQY